MNDNLPELPNGRQGPNAQDPSRRRLLRAAASAAPLIATLPCGAAAQVASTYQCVAKDRTASNLLDPTPPSTSTDFRFATDPADQWVRVLATRQLWVNQSNPLVTVYAISFPTNASVWYRETGEVFPTAGYSTSGNPVAVHVLRIYKQTTLETGNDVATDCTVTVPPLTNPPFGGCVFPVARRNTSDNMGATTSCLNSFA